MKDISYPLGPDDSGRNVKILQEVLLHIIEGSMGSSLGELMDDPRFVKKWNKEVKHSVFGRATEKAVRIFQRRIMGIKPTGIVDQATAAALERHMNKAPQPVAADTPLTVSGIVYDQWIEPMTNAVVMIVDQDIRSEHRLGEGETDHEGKYSINYNKAR